MPLRLARRTALLLPLLIAGCGDDTPSTPVRANFPPLRYAYLPPISLYVQRVEITGDFVPPAGDDQVGDPSFMADTLYAMARDRLKPVAAGGTATFRILNASITRHGDTLDGLLVVRVDVHDADNINTGFAEARVTATHSGPIQDMHSATYDMFKWMMDDMNVELEYQLRNKLKTWISEPATVPPQPVNPTTPLPPPPVPPAAVPPPLPNAPPPPPGV
jgi:hypothetical protein